MDVLLGSRDREGACNVDGGATSCPQTNVGLKPGNIVNSCHQTHFWSLHAGGGNFLRCDGSARMYTYGLPVTTLRTE